MVTVRRLARLRMLPLGAAMTAALLVACGGDTVAPKATATQTAATAATPTPSGSITVYSGRAEALIGPIIKQFREKTGVAVNVRYGDTTALAATLLEEKDRTPADVYIAQDGSALGVLEHAGMFVPLDEAVLARVQPTYKSAAKQWVGLSGRARVIAYNPKNTQADTLPKSILELTAPKWNGKIGWAPSNASLQSFVTALRAQEGDAKAKAWLEGIKANMPKEFASNGAIVQAVSKGEVTVGLVNHYYAFEIGKQDPTLSVKNHYTAAGDIGTLVNVAGAGILKSAKNPVAAKALIAFLVSDEAQKYFVDQTFEYPVVYTVQANADLKSLTELKPPAIDLNKLEDLQGTLKLMREVGVLK